MLRLRENSPDLTSDKLMTLRVSNLTGSSKGCCQQLDFAEHLRPGFRLLDILCLGPWHTLTMSIAVPMPSSLWVSLSLFPSRLGGFQVASGKSHFSGMDTSIWLASQCFLLQIRLWISLDGEPSVIPCLCHTSTIPKLTKYNYIIILHLMFSSSTPSRTYQLPHLSG